MIASELGLDVEQILRDVLGLEGVKRDDEIWMCCPVHDESKPSFSVNSVTGLSCCFSCGATFNIVSLTARLLNLTYDEAEKKLAPGSQESLLALLAARQRPLRAVPSPALPGPYDPEPLNYLRDRGLSDETLSLWGVRYCRRQTFRKQYGSWDVLESVAIPLHSAAGQKVGWVFRSTPGSPQSQPRYVYMPGAPIGQIWFGAHLFKEAEHVVVVEGSLDAMWLSQNGYPVVAALGSSPSPPKVSWLKRFERVTILADRDRAGVCMAQKLADGLKGACVVRVARYPSDSEASDPFELKPAELHRSIDKAVPTNVWALHEVV